MELNVRLTAKDTQCDGVFAALERLCKCFVQPEGEKSFTINPDKPKNEAKEQKPVPQMTPPTPGMPTAAGQQPTVTPTPTPGIPTATGQRPTAAPAPTAAPTPPVVPGIPTAVPTAAPPSFTVDQVSQAAVAFAEVSDQNRSQVVELIHSFGVNALNEITGDKLGAFVTSLRGMGARI